MTLGAGSSSAAAPLLELRELTKRFGDVVAVDRLSLAVAPGEFLTVLGASGSGKTTTLRLIAGFDRATAGAILMEGVDLAALPPFKRPVNTVFQQYALFPHMSVRDNVAYGLRMRGVARPEIARRVEGALAMVQMAELAERRPRQLSGGQQQRVALARALVNRPRVLLLDEPLGALDLKLRRQMQLELKQLQSQVGITFVYVTHDQEEALTMSDRVALVRAGRIEQLGTPREMYERPRTRYVADFIGDTNLLVATVVEDAGDLALVRVGAAVVRVRGRGAAAERHRVGDRVWLSIRPECLSLGDSGVTPGGNALPGVVSGIVYAGAATKVYVTLADGARLAVQLAPGGPSVAVGQSVCARWPAEWGVLVSA